MIKVFDIGIWDDDDNEMDPNTRSLEQHLNQLVDAGHVIISVILRSEGSDRYAEYKVVTHAPPKHPYRDKDTRTGQ